MTSPLAFAAGSEKSEASGQLVQLEAAAGSGVGVGDGVAVAVG